jgi:hypothetical protein
MGKYYVTMTDRYMSGWGQAQGRDNKLVIETDSYEEAEIVYNNAIRRPEMKYVNITDRKPRYPNAKVSWHDKSDYGRWFIRGVLWG